MRYVIIGAGALGSWLGAHLLADGNEVAFVEVGDRREALARDGLRIRKADKSALHIAGVELIEDPADAGYFDLVLVCVRADYVDAVLEFIKPLLAHESGAVVLTNGLESTARFARALGPEAIVAGFANLDVEPCGDSGYCQAEGSAHRSNPEPPATALAPPGLTLGELRRGGSWRLEGLLAAFESAGLRARGSSSIAADILSFLAQRSPVEILCARHAASVGELLTTSRAEWQTLNNECWHNARSRDSSLSIPDRDELANELLLTCPQLRPSMLRDLDAGRAVELVPYLELAPPATRMTLGTKLARPAASTGLGRNVG